MSKKSLRQWMDEGPFTLALSSAFFGFYAHCGAAEALFETGHAPAKVTGASAGAIVGAALASGLKPAEARKMIFEVRREDFWDPGPGFGYLRGKKFRRKIEPHFAASFAETKIPLAVSVFDLWSFGTRFLEEGPVAPAVVASCSVPLMFHPVIMNGRVYWDGGIFNKSGIHPGDARVLCVYLESAGVGGIYERKTSFPRLHEGHKILRFTDFPRVSFNRLERGPGAHLDIYRRTQRALEIPFDGNFLDA